MRLFRNAFFWEWSTTADGIAVRNEVTRVFGGEKSLGIAKSSESSETRGTL